MRFVELTGEGGAKIAVNPQFVIAIEDCGKRGTRILVTLPVKGASGFEAVFGGEDGPYVIRVNDGYSAVVAALQTI